MTLEEPTVRRSQRVHTATERSSQYVSDLSDIDDVNSAQEEVDSQSDQDEEYYDTAVKKRKAKLKAATIKKKQKSSKRKLASSIEEVSDFVENYIFQALSDPDISINELATNWLELYEFNSVSALKDLINFVLRCCGCLLQIEEHDVENNESAVDTVGEIQQLFMKQQYHEYPLLTTNTKWKSFRSNVMEFVSLILSVANEKELLCNPEADLMENLLIWLSAISTCSLRPLRYTATSILLTMESSLCEIMGKTFTDMGRQQRQLYLETNKLKLVTEKLKKSVPLREKTKLEKDQANVERRLQEITSSVKIYKDQKVILEEYLKDITNTTFVHRYRDVDPKIRQECMASLGKWIDLYPEMFFETSYLRYFGWNLSDQDAGVRLEVVRSLLKLYRNAVIVPGFRQFTERFKGRLIEMVIYDSDYNVRLTTVSVLFEISKIGFLDEEEVLQISSLIFCDQSNKVNLICTTENKYYRLQYELVKFISVTEGEMSKEFRDKHQEGILNSGDSFTLDLSSMIKLKNLSYILQKSFEYFLENYSNLESHSQLASTDKFIRALKLVYSLPSSIFTNSIEFLIKYLTFDSSALTLVDDSIKQKIELSAFDKDLLFCYICALSSIQLDTDNLLQPAIVKSHIVAKPLEDGSNMNQKDTTINTLITYLDDLFSLVKNKESSLLVFVKIFIDLYKSATDNQDNRITKTMDETLKRLLTTFVEHDSQVNEDQFSAVFRDLLKTVYSGTVDQGIEIMVESVVMDIGSALIFNLNLLNQSDPIGDIMASLSKLEIVGQCVDITECLEKEDKETGKSIIDLICSKCLKNEDYKRDEVDSVLKIFKFLSCYITLKLKGVLSDKKQLLLSDDYILSETLKQLSPICSTVTEISLDEGIPVELKLEASVFNIDLLVALKSFNDKLSLKLKNLENDEKLADLKTFFEITVPLKLNKECTKSALRMFLVMESKFASFANVELDRDENEDVNFDWDDDLSGAQLKIDCENNLCRLTMELLSLLNLNMLPSDIVKRLSLNKDQLDSQLFNKLFERKESIEPMQSVDANSD